MCVGRRISGDGLGICFFFSSRRRHTRLQGDWSSDVCSSDLNQYVNVRMTSPDLAPLIAYAEAWTPGTNGPIQGRCMRVAIEDKKDFDKYKGKLDRKSVV